MRRRYNYRLIKIHRSYTVEELALLLGTHKNTVRNWVKGGLPTIDQRRPALILGTEARSYLEECRKKSKRPCAPGEIYCVKCRTPKVPDGKFVEYVPRNLISGNLRGICPDCQILINRGVSLGKLESVRGDLEVLFPEAEGRIEEHHQPTVNCDFGSALGEPGNAQRE